MRPRERRDSGEQDLFRARLDQIIDMNHALAKLARAIDWRFLEEKFGSVYTDQPGRRPLPTRLMAGLAILKHTFNLSDEVVCDRWIENPYYQYFCGEIFLQHTLPLDRPSITRWRNRMGEERLNALLQKSLAVATREALGAPTAREAVERILLRVADLQTDPQNPPGCLLVAGGLACGAGSENVPFELAVRRAQKEEQLRERFIRAREEGDLAPDDDPTALAKFVSAVIAGMGVLASSGSDREELRHVAMVAVKAFDKKPSVLNTITDATEPTIVPAMPAA
jgi:hypothetical protein